MTAIVMLSCDGHRHGQPCRGAKPLPPHRDAREAAALARAAGWRIRLDDDLCPSRGHDEEPQP